MRGLLALSMLISPLLAQEGPPFPEEARNPWVPAWEWTLKGDRVNGLQGDTGDFQRILSFLRLRWTWESGPFDATLGTRHALGSDGNQFNVDRYDQQVSNGSRLDLAQIRWRANGPRAFGEVRAGLQEAGLVSHESFWDKDLRVAGLGFRLAFRGEEHLQEAGLRGVVGRVPTLVGGKVDLVALQAVAKFDTGAWSWTFHAGRWELHWDPTDYREHPLPGLPTNARQRLVLDAAGGGLLWNGPLPIEVRSVFQRNPDTSDRGTETQIKLGSRARAWWPQAGFTWQRFERTGTLYPVNGDEWWWIANARGPRYELGLALPAHWFLSATYIRHRWYPGEQLVERRFIVLTKQF